MRYYKPINFALMFLILAVLALCLAPGCALSKPQKTIVLNLAAQNCGFLLVQEKPELAQDIFEVSESILTMDFVGQHDFYDWSGWVIEALKLDPFLQMNFKELIKLVDIEITLASNQQEIVKLVYGVIQNFIIGIKAGR